MGKAASVPIPLHRFVGDKVGELGRWVPLALRFGDVEAVHQARVTTRRLKAALDLLKPALARDGRRGFSKVLRRLRRSLGALRDVDVMLGHLGEMGLDKRHGEVANWLRGRLHARRAELLESIGDKRSPEDLVEDLGLWRELEEQVKAAEGTAPGLAKEALPGRLEAFREGADRLTLDGAVSEGAGADGGSGDVHQLRIDGKLLRYTLELGQPLGFAVKPGVMKNFKKMQEALGLWHDFVVLSEETLRSALEEMLASTSPRLYGEALELARVLWQRSERHLGQFRGLWAKEGEVISGEIIQTFRLGDEHLRVEDAGIDLAPVVEVNPVDAQVPGVGDDLGAGGAGGAEGNGSGDDSNGESTAA